MQLHAAAVPLAVAPLTHVAGAAGEEVRALTVPLASLPG